MGSGGTMESSAARSRLSRYVGAVFRGAEGLEDEPGSGGEEVDWEAEGGEVG